ncbi:hypothetical protein OIU76_025603 [Salix suchowensis]|nr:hypothetical protein OIU76_025603 [Salix suchowensis]
MISLCCSFWMDGLYLQSMLDPDNHLLNLKTTLLIAAGSDSNSQGINFIIIQTIMVSKYHL